MTVTNSANAGASIFSTKVDDTKENTFSKPRGLVPVPVSEEFDNDKNGLVV